MTPLTLQEGSLFTGRYRVLRCIAMGGMGAVYEVMHVETERRRALKVMLPHVLESADLRDRFRKEARVAAHIESEHIVDVFDAGVDEQTGMPFMVMELLRGEELGKRLERVGRIAPQEAVLYLHQVARALDKTHRAAIVHRDLKPANLFLTVREDGRPHIKILDFGIAKLVAEGGTGANATRALGTPLFMAPEQFRTGGAVFPAADIYALGMLAFRLLAGFPYWLEESRTESGVFAFAMTAMHGPQESAVARAARHGAALPVGFDDWFKHATAVDPKARFSSAGDAVAGLMTVFGFTQGYADSVRVELPAETESVSVTMHTPTLHQPPRQLTPESGPSSLAAHASGSHALPVSPSQPQLAFAQPPLAAGPSSFLPGTGTPQVVPGSTSVPHQSGPQVGNSSAFSLSQAGVSPPAPGNKAIIVAMIAVIAALFAVVSVLLIVLRSPSPSAVVSAEPTTASTVHAAIAVDPTPGAGGLAAAPPAVPAPSSSNSPLGTTTSAGVIAPGSTGATSAKTATTTKAAPSGTAVKPPAKQDDPAHSRY